MARLTCSTPAKIAAVILSYVTVVIFVLSALSVAVMGYYKFYFSEEETVISEIISDMADNEANYIDNLLYKKKDLSKYYADKNVFYVITNDATGEILETNYNGEAYIATGDSYHYHQEDYIKYQDDDNTYWETETTIYEIKVYIAENMTKNDIFSVTLKIIQAGYRMQIAVIFIMIGSLVLAVTLLCFLFCSAGHTKDGNISLNYIDRLPMDVYTVLTAAIIGAGIFIVFDIANSLISAVAMLLVVGSLDYFIILGYAMSFATRIKTRTVIKNTLIYRVIKFIANDLKKLFGWIKYIISNLTLVYKTVLLLCVFILIELLFISYFISNYVVYFPEIFYSLIVFFNIILVASVLYLAIIAQKIKTGGEKIAGGQLEHKIDTNYMFGDFKAFCESLNNINDGLQSAVDEKMKSERFKTELITNVSHDIKTPLTSIINYVDLIKKENPENENVKQYIEVLDRQSGKLKKLVEDLVEASKASTGNLAVNLASCNVGVLLTQTLGEFEDSLAKAQIEPILRLYSPDIIILADSRHMWRIFENLMSNICKYAQNGTRAYLDLKEENGKAVITFRNISRYQLEISADELTERFIRGDRSRNTEGSGLGLSIAKSLVELQGGNMKLDVDGDLFKVTLKFDVS